MWAVSETVSRFRFPIATMIVFLLMTFSPWIYFAYQGANPHFIALPFAVGLASALAMLPKTRGGALIGIATVMLFIVPTNIVGHMLAHLTSIGCYD